MITLPPYHPDYNPTEFVFRSLLKRIRSEQARYTSLNADDFWMQFVWKWGILILMILFHFTINVVIIDKIK